MRLPELKIGDLTSRLPIIQGGMGIGVSMSRLASAVADKGGVGVISGAMTGIGEPDVTSNSTQANLRVLKREIRNAKQATSGVLGVNIMFALTDYPALVETSLDEGIDIIFVGAGLPLDLPGYLKNGHRTKLVPIISSARAAKIICKRWLSRFDYLPDAFVVEGPAAGGHLGFKPEQLDDPDFALDKLVPEVIKTVNQFANARNQPIPVIAAGGIYTGADIYRFLKLGVAGVQMGTRFVATHECDADDNFKQVYINAHKEDMVVINSPVGMPGRAVRNDFINQVNDGQKKPFKCPFHCIKPCTRETSPYCITLALESARRGRFRSGFAFAGKNAYRVDKVVSVSELIDELIDEFNRDATQA
ncbi:nitronate monooxygenase family protein [Desulfococcaceae bacterium HSG9]|nr:nitronate monooxygenase family protein [Desulfococcaceae bacterium HSG9]